MYDPRQSGFRRDYTDIFNGIRSKNPVSSVPRYEAGANMVTVLSDDVNVKMSILDRKISELDELFTKRARPTFDNTELELCDHRIQQITSEISQKISNLSLEIKRPIETHDPEVVNLLVNLQQCHRLKLANLVQRFRHLQATRRPVNLTHEEQNDPIAAMYADFHPQVSPDQAMLIQRNEEMMEQQDELQGLVVMMNELNTMFRDVSLLIFEQGTILDRIDTRIEVAVQDVQRGNEDLRAANEHQKSRCFYWYIGLMMVLISLCLIIMIYRAVRK